MPSNLSADDIFVLWCELSRTPIGSVTVETREQFTSNPLVPRLRKVPYGQLVDAGRSVVVDQPSLPLVLWLGAVDRIDQIVLDETLDLTGTDEAIPA